jgi:hypothetical protein
MSKDNVREKFEEAFQNLHPTINKKLLFGIRKDGKYASLVTNSAWKSYQAAHAESTARIRDWVGLTDNEVSDCWIEKDVSGTAFDIYFFARAIETKLKEKNT